MKTKQSITISVRNLVEFVLKSGDLESGFTGSSRSQDGIMYHQLLQKKNTAMCRPGTEYIPEVSVSCTVTHEDLSLVVGGRIDGVIRSDSGITIEEIKTTTRDIKLLTGEENALHWAQAKCYAFIYGTDNDAEQLAVRLTYFHVDEKKSKSFQKDFTLAELKIFFDSLVTDYMEWARTLQRWADTRNASCASLGFPFLDFRPGQQDLMNQVKQAISTGGKIFAQAPTGTGKTIATLYPAVQCLGEGLTAKIFYLTAKTVTRSIAENACGQMRNGGLRFKTTTITAKEKICFMPEAGCKPDECQFAKGYYDRRRNAVNEAFASDDAFTRQVIEEHARKHCLCPFEFSLDMALWCDGIICDYNYVFDPSVYLRRFFAEAGENSTENYTFLIDEAHNLVDRSRDMFSAELLKEPVTLLRKMLSNARGSGKDPRRISRLYRIAGKINTWFTEAQDLCEESPTVKEGWSSYLLKKEAPEEVYPVLRNFLSTAEKLLADGTDYGFRETLLEIYFEVYAFLRTAECYDEHYVTYFERNPNDIKVKLFCTDPAHLLKETLTRGKAAVFFSATLTPLDYFARVLGGDADSEKILLPSPFPSENLAILVSDRISTKYRMREQSYGRVVEAIAAFVKARTGNYLVYFSSYQYMNKVRELFEPHREEAKVLFQREGMSETDRADFLDEFSSFGSRTLIAFAVMGGVFGEGIDLVGEKLSGVIVVGVGLPQICFERNLIREYYQELEGAGYEFAYLYPGMNKVLQAVGRLIRSETDRGMALLIDERFSESAYRRLFPKEWRPVTARDTHTLSRATNEFWGQ